MSPNSTRVKYTLRILELDIGDYSPTLNAELLRNGKTIADVTNKGQDGPHKFYFWHTNQEADFLLFCLNHNTNPNNWVESHLRKYDKYIKEKVNEYRLNAALWGDVH